MQNGIYSQELKTVCNAVIQIGDIDDTGKGRHFVSKFIQDGLVKIEGHGIVLLKKETIDQSLQSMVGAPVIIKHQDVTNENADELRCGVISKAYFNDFDGWYYCEGIIWDEKAKELVNNGWSVSCSYDYLAYNDEGGEENNIHYDKEFTQLNFTHLALVNNPRYERANIVFNCKVNNLRNSELPSDKGKWITINGNHIFIPDGKTLDEVIEEKGWKEKEKGKSETQKESNTTKDTKKHIDRIEKLIKKYNLEPHEEDELLDELGSFEAKLDENLEPREEEVLREELFDFEDDIKRHQEMKKQEKSDTKDKQEPEWLQREKQKLDRQTTQMYEDRYSVEHPETYKKNLEKAKGKQSETKKESNTTKDTRRHIDRIEKLIKKYNLEPHEEDELLDELGSFEAKLDENLEPREEEELREQLFDFEDDIKRHQEMKKQENKTNNSKEQEMALLNELKKLISKVENEKGEQDMDEKEKVDNKKVDKRKLIDEVGGILKGKVDDEIIRTVMKKMEKVSYNGSEDDKADNGKEEDKKDDVENKCKNETEEDKKEVKEVKEEVKEDVDNKCKNSKSSFDKINEIYNSIKQVTKESKYVSRQEKLDNAVEYFK